MFKRRNISIITVVAIAMTPVHPEVMGMVVLGMHVRNIAVINRHLTLTPVQLKLPSISIQRF